MALDAINLASNFHVANSQNLLDCLLELSIIFRLLFGILFKAQHQNTHQKISKNQGANFKCQTCWFVCLVLFDVIYGHWQCPSKGYATNPKIDSINCCKHPKYGTGIFQFFAGFVDFALKFVKPSNGKSSADNGQDQTQTKQCTHNDE